MKKGDGQIMLNTFLGRVCHRHHLQNYRAPKQKQDVDESLAELSRINNQEVEITKYRIKGEKTAKAIEREKRLGSSDRIVSLYIQNNPSTFLG